MPNVSALARTVLRHARQLVAIRRRAKLIVRFVPRERWFAAAMRFSRLQWALSRAIWWRKDILLRNALFPDHMLSALTRYGAFPIPWRLVGEEYLPGGVLQRNGESVVYCTIHVPLFTLQIHVSHLHRRIPKMVVVFAGNIDQDGTYAIVGTKERWPAMPPGGQTLVKMRRELANGGTAASMLDAYAGGPMRAQLLQFAGRVKANVVFIWTEIAEDGVPVVTYAPAPHLICDTQEKVEANLLALERKRAEILSTFYRRKKAR